MEILIFITIFLSIIGVFSKFRKSSIEQSKSRLMNMYSSVLSDMNLDYQNTTISIENIRNIAKSILNFSCEIKTITTQVEQLSEENKKWLFMMISEFSQNLTLWINRHMDELQMTKAQIFDGIPGENATIELLDKRIDLQIENLQKIVL